MGEYQVVPINYGQGVDTKTDPKLIVAGKMLRLENAVFTKVKQIAKRNGYQPLGTAIANNGTLSAPKMVHEYNEQELIAADKNLLISYSPNENAWESKGQYISTELTKNSIDQEIVASGAVDNAVLGKYILYGYSTATRIDGSFPAAYPSFVWGQVVDSDTGTILVKSNLFHATNAEFPNPVRCVLLGNTTLGIIYVNLDTDQLFIQTVNFGANGIVTFNAAVQISTNFTQFSFDVQPTSTGAVITYFSATGLTVSTLNTAGSVVSSAIIVDAGALSPLSLSINSFNNSIWVYWTSGATGEILYAVFTSTLAVILARTAILVQAAPQFAVNMISISNSATQQVLFYDSYQVMGTKSVDTTFAVIVNSTGVVSPPAYFAAGVVPYSHPFTIGTDQFAVFLYRGALALPSSTGVIGPQPTFFLIKLTSLPTTGIPLSVAKIGAGISNAQLYVFGTISYTPNISVLSSNKIIFTAALETQEFVTDSFASSDLSVPAGISGAFSYYVDFASSNSYRAIECGELAILNGGHIYTYDGNSCNELNFNVFPEIAFVQLSVSTGAIANGSYSYIAIFQWTDNQGNLHQSAPSEAFPVVVAGANNTVALYITKDYLTQKKGTSLAVYRTKAGGTTYFQVSDPIFLTALNENIPPAYVVFNDGLSDAQITGNPQPYTSPGSSVLENTTPPPSMAMLSHNNRLFFVDSENPNTIWYTKSFSPGTGLSPSGFMTEQIDPKFGNISALAEVDDKLIIFKQSGIFVQSGDGVNDVGSGQTFSFPQIVPSDVGCDNLKSAVLLPTGVMFHSANGIYLIGRSLNVEYLGMPVEQYNNQLITSATLITGKSQVRFLCSSGLTLVYDYIFDQWSTFTNHAGLSSDIWKNSYVYCVGGNVFKEVPNFYLDNAASFNVLAQTGWLTLSSVQNFQRVRRLIMLGDFTNGASISHGIQVQAAYDFSTTFQSVVPFTFNNSATTPAFQYRERLPQQKCDAISLLIQEIVSGDSSEYMDLTNISFEACIKRGVNKLPAAQSVG